MATAKSRVSRSPVEAISISSHYAKAFEASYPRTNADQGRPTVFGQKIRSGRFAEMQKSVLGGIPASSTDKLALALRISRETLIKELGITRSVVAAKLAAGDVLSAEYSDKVYRAERLFQQAKDVFLAEDDAAMWMVEENSWLGATPLSMARTTPGFERALAALDRITFGLPA